MSSRGLRGSIERQRAALLKQAADHLIADAGADVSEQLRQAESHTKVLAILPRARWPGALGAIAVGLFCLALVGLASTVRIPQSRLVLNVDAESVGLTLVAPFTWRGDLPISGDLRLDNMSSLEFPIPTGEMAQLRGAPWLELRGGRATLAKLDLGAGGVLMAEKSEDGRVELFVSGSAFEGALAVWAKHELKAGDAPGSIAVEGPLDLPIAETVTFGAEHGDTVPARVQLRTGSELILGDLRIGLLSFAREEALEPGTAIFASTIRTGQLQLSDVDQRISLQRGDRLSLEGIAGRIQEIRIGDAVSVAFEGRARRVGFGPDGYEQDLTPTVLSYLYHNQRVIFLWSAASFVWGMLWSARQLLVG